MAKATETEATKDNGKAKGKRGDGPLSIMFVDKDSKQHKRVPSNVVGVIVTPKGGEAKMYSVTDLSPDMRNQLAAMAIAKRADTTVRNTVKKGDGANVLGIVDGIYASLQDGKLYSRAEGAGAGAGRPFDFDLWVEAMAETSKSKKQPASEKQLADFRRKLEGWSAKERSDATKKWQKDQVFALSLKTVQARRIKAKVQKGEVSEVDAMADLF